MSEKLIQLNADDFGDLMGQGFPCPGCESHKTKKRGERSLTSERIELWACSACQGLFEVRFLEEKRPEPRGKIVQLPAMSERSTAELTDSEIRILDWGMELRFWIQGIRLVPVGNLNEVVKLGMRRSIRKSAEAEAFIRQIRATTMQLVKKLKTEQPEMEKVRFPLPGAECPIRVDILVGYSKADEQDLYRHDLDNLAKGILDGLKYGEIDKGVSFGIIDDDRYITELVMAKGQAPPDDPETRILIKISRAGFRDSRGLAYLMNAVGPFPPWLPAIQNPTRILRPGDDLLPPGLKTH